MLLYGMTLPATFVVMWLCVGVAVAKPVALAPYDAGGKLTVSLPKGWTVTPDLDKGLIAAQQDPARKDAAAVLLLVQTSASATEDQLLDAIVASVSKDVKVGKREALPGGQGRLMIADGTVDGLKVRLGVIAVVSNGASVVSLLVAKVGDFDKLGGTELVTAILASIKVPGAAAPAAASPATSGTKTAITQPQLDSYGHLVVPRLDRKLELAELAGEWRQDDSAITSYVSTSTGAYAGFSSVATTQNWTLDAKGNVFSSFVGTTAGRGGAHQTVEKKYGTASLDANMVLTIKWKTGFESHFLVRGFVELAGMTVMNLNGPWYAGGVPADVLGDPNKGANLDAMWARARTK